MIGCVSSLPCLLISKRNFQSAGFSITTLGSLSALTFKYHKEKKREKTNEANAKRQ